MTTVGILTKDDNSRISTLSRGSLRLGSQMNRLRQVTRQMIAYLSKLSGFVKSVTKMATECLRTTKIALLRADTTTFLLCPKTVL